MGFFRRDAADDGHSEQPARGGVPPMAQARLHALGTRGSLFTSGLSVNEFALLDRLGPRPLAQVMGASVVQTGWQYLPALPPGVATGASPMYPPQAITWRVVTEASPAQVRTYRWHAEVICELDTLTDAWNMARRQALDRLSEEAREVGADAVVGVHLHRGDLDLGKGTVEYVVTGTAIRRPDCTGVSWPTLTDVSVQNYWRLHQAGFEPVGLLATTSVVFASPPLATRLRRVRTTMRNQELTELSHGFQAARATVRARLLGQVGDARGAGAVGVELSHSVHRDKLPLASSLGSPAQRGWNRGALGLPYLVRGRSEAERRGWVITMHAAGTAIRRRRGSAAPALKTTIRMGGG